MADGSGAVISLISRSPLDLTLPVLVSSAGERARLRFLEFFAAQIRNPNTRRAYARAVSDFLSWCADFGVTELTGVTPLHVATWIEFSGRTLSAPSVKQALAALRHLFDWLVTGQVLTLNPAASVRGPAHSARVGKTPVLEAAEARALLDSIDVSSPAGLRDRALIALMVFSFARIGAALTMRVEDVFVQNRRLWVRLREKGGKQHVMPCHHTLEDYLHAYLDGTGLPASRRAGCSGPSNGAPASFRSGGWSSRTRTPWCGAGRRQLGSRPRLVTIPSGRRG